MSEIFRFDVERAFAKIDQDRNIMVNLCYPNNPRVKTSRATGNPALGINVFNQLLSSGEADLGNSTAPFIPPSAGSVYLLKDDCIIVHRRDLGARVNKLYHSISAGFPANLAEVSSEQGIRAMALRESAEECLLVTKDDPPWLIVPSDSREVTLESARKMGLDLKQREVNAEAMPGTDSLEVMSNAGQHLFKMKAILDFAYSPTTCFNVLYVRKLSVSSEEIVPIDAEGILENDRLRRFNRESYRLKIPDLHKLKLGDVLTSPSVYKAEIIPEGKPVVEVPGYSTPYQGPDGLVVKDPHIFAPDCMLTRILDALSVEGYIGKWMKIALWREETKLRNESLLGEAAQSRLQQIMGN